MIRFFVRPDQIVENTAILEDADAHHLRVVLKSLPGDTLAVLDGLGNEYPATLTQVGKSRAIATLGPGIGLQTESTTRVSIAQALPRMNEKMEQVLQRGTEVGASAFWAFTSVRSHAHLTGERHDKRLARWREIVKSAAEQSHRALIPSVRAEGALQDVVAAAIEYDLTLIAYEGEQLATLRSTLRERSSPPGNVLILIGPEGGFTIPEVELATKLGAVSVSLGRRILRTETAAMVMAAQIIYELG